MQAVYGGFSPQRFAILHFILHLSSMQLLKTWVVLFTVLENMYGSTKSEYYQLCIGSDRENFGPVYAIICTVLQMHGVLRHCPLCFFQACAPSLSSPVLDPPSFSLLTHSFLFAFPDLSQSLNACERFLTKTLVKKGNMAVWADKIMMKAIYISISPPYLVHSKDSFTDM